MHTEVATYFYKKNLAEFIEDSRLSFEDQLVIYCASINSDNPVHYTTGGKNGKKTKNFTENVMYWKGRKR